MFTIPDKGEGQNDIQSILFQEDLDIFMAGVNGLDLVLSGCACTAQGSPDMTVAVAKGAVLTNGALKAVTAGNVTIDTAHASFPRIDLIVVNSSGTKAVRAGTAAAAPKPPVRTANDVVLAFVYVPANDTTISSDQIIDKKVTRTQGPVTIYKTTTAETTNNTAALIQALDKTNSGVSIPNGLFTSGRILHGRIGGNMLINSGTPTVTLTLSYGGTTMFADASVASVAGTVRAAWYLIFDLVAQANNDQALVGSLFLTPIDVARTAATTGIGDLAFANTSNRLGAVPFSGSAAVDSDAADRVLSVGFTFSVANAANELVVESATLELL